MGPLILSDDIISTSQDEIPDVPTMSSRMSEDDFVQWSTTLEDVRAEWIDGEAQFMSPVSARHVQILGWLQTLLNYYVQEKSLGAVIGPEFAVRLQANGRISRRVPDLMFVRSDRLDLIRTNHLDGPPDFAIEIVSPDSIKRDWADKLTEYPAAGVREYWIIDPQSEKFDAFVLDQNGKFVSTYDPRLKSVESQVIDGFRIDVEWLWQKNPPAFKAVWSALGVM